MPATSKLRKWFDGHPILIPACTFTLCWVPYLIVFFRSSITFGKMVESILLSQDSTLRFIMPVLSAQPMFFASAIFSTSIESCKKAES